MQNVSNEQNPWADETVEVSPDNLLWKQYVVYVDLFKFYVDMTWRASTWFYAITGAILTYYFGHIADNDPLLRYALVLPFLLSIGLSFIFHRGVRQTKDLDEKLEYIRERLNLAGKPHIEVLERFLWIGRLLFLLVGIGVCAVFLLSFAA